MFIPGLVSGRLFDIGHFKIPFFVASCLLVAATFLVPLCTEYWHFLLCQGIAVGVSSQILTYQISTVSHLVTGWMRHNIWSCNGCDFALVQKAERNRFRFDCDWLKHRRNCLSDCCKEIDRHCWVSFGKIQKSAAQIFNTEYEIPLDHAYSWFHLDLHIRLRKSSSLYFTDCRSSY